MSLTPSLDPKLPSTNLDARDWTNRRASAQALKAAQARHSSGRRRFVDPATCERDYSTAEMEFMQAMQDYKFTSGRMFPTWSEVLEVLRSIGYEKVVGDEGLDCDTEIFRVSLNAYERWDKASSWIHPGGTSLGVLPAGLDFRSIV